jgi:hypothetical protein
MKTTLLTALMLGLVACTTEKQIVEVERPVVTVEEKMNSDELTDAAEQLIGPFTFMLADKVLDRALVQNPTNQKALLYKAMLRPMMATRGLWKRARPFARANGNLGKWDQIMTNFPESPLKKFYSEGPEDIVTTEDALGLVDEIREGFNEMRKMIKSNPDMNLVMNLNPHAFEKFIKDKTFQNCKVVETHDGWSTHYEFQCDYTNVAIMKANNADFAALQQMAAGWYLWLTMYTGYSLDGVEELAQLDPNNHMSIAGKQAFLESKKNFGLKRTSNSWKQVRSLGSDLAAASRWALQFQETLCPPPVQQDLPPWMAQSQVRRPNYVFEKGICVKDSPEGQRMLSLFEALLIGPQNVEVKRDHGTQLVNVDPFGFLNNPVADLRAILPSNYNPCGAPSKLRDSSVGGLLPNADADQFMSQSCH